MLEALFTYGLGANDNDGYGNVLCYYIKDGGCDERLITYLLHKGAHFEDLGKDGWSLLHRLAYAQQAGKIEPIAHYGANLDVRTRLENGAQLLQQTALMLAAGSPNEPIGQACATLVRLGAELNVTDNNRTALDEAIGVNVEILRKAGAKTFAELRG